MDFQLGKSWQSIKSAIAPGDFYRGQEEVILRDFLAIERTRLANERTLLSYLRSSVYLIIGGIAFIQLKEFANLLWLGYLCLVLSVFFVVIGVYRFYWLKKRLAKMLKLFKPENEHTST